MEGGHGVENLLSIDRSARSIALYAIDRGREGDSRDERKSALEIRIEKERHLNLFESEKSGTPRGRQMYQSVAGVSKRATHTKARTHEQLQPPHTPSTQ